MKPGSQFIPGEFYHIFNRANSQHDKLFFQERNYAYFLVRVKGDGHQEVKERFRKFSICYAQAINKQEHRRGSLFQEHPKYVLITEEAHLL